MFDTVLLLLIAFGGGFLNSAFAAGGNILILVGFTYVFPLGAVVPLQGAINIASSVFRICLDPKSIQPRIVLHLVLGTAIGIALITPLVPRIPVDIIPIILGSVILILLWMPHVHPAQCLPYPFLICGVIQGMATMIIGPTGPILLLFLLDAPLNKNEMVATVACTLIGVEICKILAFLSIGFDYTPYLGQLGMMAIAVLAGTIAGRIVRRHCDESIFRLIIKIILSLLALQLIFR